MPRNVRNFWLVAGIDGRESTLEGGPIGKDGGMRVEILMREEGHVSPGVTVRCMSYEGKNTLVVEDANGVEVYRTAYAR